MQFPRFKLLPTALVVLMILLQYRLWFESGGVMEMLRIKKELAVKTHENSYLKQRNELMLAEVRHLQKNKDAVESRARHELGMIKQGETFYQVIEQK